MHKYKYMKQKWRQKRMGKKIILTSKLYRDRILSKMIDKTR